MTHKMVKLSYEDMMEKFIPPVVVEPEAALFKNIFDQAPAKMEADFLKSLGVSLNKHVAGDDWQFVVFTKSDPPSKSIEIEMYPKCSAAVLEKRSNWSAIELYIAACAVEGLDPFEDDISTEPPPRCDEVQDPDLFSDSSSSSSERITTRTFLDQIMEHTDIVFQRQQRTHYYTLAIFGRYARIARWDRSGCVYSDRFDYMSEPAKLVLFLWRLSHAATPDVRGHDPSATRVLWASAEYHAMMLSAKFTSGGHARELFAKSLVDTWPWWKLTIPNVDPKKPPHVYLVGEPTFYAREIVGRGTRGYVALDYTDPTNPGPFVYLKDCWTRVVHPRSEQEGAILTYLNSKGVRYIPTMLCHGDIGEKMEMARDVWKEVHGTEKKCPLKNHRHYRLVVKEVGKPLKTFENGRALVWVVLNAVIAHRDAYTNAHTIHRDLSVGNILIMPDPDDPKFGCHGLLTDWELSKRTDEEDLEPRHPDRTGTWQFMSVNALQGSRKQIVIPDEMESVFHILLYCSIRYLPHTCGNVGEFMRRYFDDGVPVDDNPKEFTCGLLKAMVLTGGVLRAHDQNPIVFLLERPSPAANIPAHPSPPPANPANPSSSSPADPCSSPSPSGSRSSPLSQSQPKQLLAPRKEYSSAQRHPMDRVLRRMLPLFGALYRLQDHTVNQVKKGSEKKKLETIDETQEPEGHRRARNLFLNKPPRPVDREDPAPLNPPHMAMLKFFEQNALKLQEHTEIGRILAEAAFQVNERWPKFDKTEDQLLSTYKPDRESTQKAKPPKRSAADTSEEREHKKPRGALAASQT